MSEQQKSSNSRHILADYRMTNKKANFEDVLNQVGGFGRYPMLLAVYMCYVTIVVDFHQFIQTYYGSAPNFNCVPHDSNTTRSCAVNKCACQNCTFVFDGDFTSAVSEWNLICDRAHLKAMTQAVYMAGLLVGSVGFGKFSDHFGRRYTTFLSLFLMVVFGLGSTFADSLVLFSAMRFGSGLSTSGALLVKFVYCMEISTLAYRTAMGIICNLFVVLGALILALMAYLIRDWRYLMLAVTLPTVPPLFLWRWVPESPRWLIAKGRLKEAQQVLERFAVASGVVVDSKQLSVLIHEVKESESGIESSAKRSRTGVLDLVRTPKMRKRTLVLSYNWFVNSVVFYGITLNAKNLGGSLHLNVFILFVVGIPAILTLWLVLTRFGRRIGYCTFMLLGGLACLMVIAVPRTTGAEHPAIKGLAVFGDFCIIATFSGVYIYNSELSPTLLRNISLGVGSMMSRVGGIIAPYIVFLNDFMQNLPLVVFGAMAFTAGLAALLLPETLFSPMPQTVEQVESWGEDYGVPCRRKLAGRSTEHSMEVNVDNVSEAIVDKKTTLIQCETTI